MSAREVIVQIVALADGSVTGRVRLQKMVYLLKRKGLRGKLDFSYHHYGPFSRDVDHAIAEAKTFCGLREDVGRRASDGAPYSVFVLSDPASRMPDAEVAGIPVDGARNAITAMMAVPSTVIEIAATVIWLRDEEGLLDWQPELRRRKGAKASPDRLQQALELLRGLDLDLTLHSRPSAGAHP